MGVVQILETYLSYTSDTMNKQIIHFGKDPNKPEFYNLIVKVTDPSSRDQTKEVWIELKYHGFHIHHYDEYSIEAVYKDRYQKTLDKFRELEKTDWKK